MPDNLVINVRQLAQYPARSPVAPTDLMLLQAGGLGGPYYAATASAFITTVGLNPDGPFAWSVTPPPAPPAANDQIMTGSFVAPLGGSMLFNAYGTAAGHAYWASGQAGAFEMVAGGVFNWLAAPSGTADATISSWATPMTLSPAGQLTLLDTLTVARDPTAALEVATRQYVDNHSVSSFNTRTGAVTFLVADFNAATVGNVATAPTAAPGDSSTQLATTAFVHAAIAALPTEVTSFNTRTGAVTLTAADITGAGGALLASPNFSGAPNAPTANPGTSTGQLATTAFVQAAIAAATTGVSSWNTRTGAVVLTQSDIVNAAGWASPSFTGIPLAPTAATPTNNTQIATTAFVHAALLAGAPGVTTFNTRSGAVVLTAADVSSVNGALLASPAFTGTPTANTAAPGTNTTQLATTAFVAAALAAISTGVTSFNGRIGAITLQGNDVSAAGGVVSASPAFTGVPTAPTATTGDSSFQLATTQFVAEAIAAGVSGVSTWNGRAGAVVMTIADVTGVGGAPVASPTFTGVPLAPTATAGTSTQQLATTAFVGAATAPLAPRSSPTFTGTASFAGPIAPSDAGIRGRTDGTAAPAGAIGEYLSYVSGTVLFGWATWGSFSLALSPGDWDVWGLFDGSQGGVGGTQLTACEAGLSTTSGVQPNLNIVEQMGGGAVNPNWGLALGVPALQVNTAATTTIYLNGIIYGSGGSPVGINVIGKIYARRRS